MTLATFLLCAASILTSSTATESSTCTTNASGSCSTTDVNDGSVDDVTMLQKKDVIENGLQNTGVIETVLEKGYNSLVVGRINDKLEDLDSVIVSPALASYSTTGCVIPDLSGGCYCNGSVSFHLGLDECSGGNTAKLSPASISLSGSSASIEQDASMGPLSCQASISAEISGCGKSFTGKGVSTAGVESISIKGGLKASYSRSGLEACLDGLQLEDLNFGPISFMDITSSTDSATYTITADQLDKLWSQLPVHDISDTISKTVVSAINGVVSGLGKQCFGMKSLNPFR